MPPGSSQSGLNCVSQSSTRPSSSRSSTWAISRLRGSAEFITPENPCGPPTWSVGQPGEQVEVVVTAVGRSDGLALHALLPEPGPQQRRAGPSRSRAGDRRLQPAQALAEQRVVGRGAQGLLQARPATRPGSQARRAHPARLDLDANGDLGQRTDGGVSGEAGDSGDSGDAPERPPLRATAARPAGWRWPPPRRLIGPARPGPASRPAARRSAARRRSRPPGWPTPSPSGSVLAGCTGSSAARRPPRRSSVVIAVVRCGERPAPPLVRRPRPCPAPAAPRWSPARTAATPRPAAGW